MQTFVMLTRISPEHVPSPESLETLEQQVMERIQSECPDVEWIQNYAVLGPYDYLDIFSAPDVETATRVATLIRTYGHAQCEVWAATEWARFKDMLHHMEHRAA